MIVAFLIRNRHRRRIARSERLIRVTLLLIPTVVKMAHAITRAYVGAWKGPHAR